ncbi:uncharacterized protein LOC142327007 [Lycorma delicatula]|uniref:uncharacterized protein LOC142327007 n=1 Tax=Lycorma delicatula TaxID=130591 RepID=UPI003F50D777
MLQNTFSIIEKVYECVSNPHKIITENISPVVREWPLMSTPTYTFAILGFYLYFCLFLGPRLMRNRKPFELDKVMIVYNVIQIVSNIYLFYKVAAAVISSSTSMLLTANEEWEDEKRIYVYYYFLNKILDLADTIFMVLRKKNSQISFLHLYHHTVMVIVGWFFVAYIGAAMVAFFGAVNTFIHSVMYFYYLLTAARPEYKKSVWWKRHLTQLQLIQFIIVTIHATLNVLSPSSNFPKGLVAIFIPQGVIMMPQNASSIIGKTIECVSIPHKIITENISPVVQEWPLMSTPTYTIAILGFYLYFCLFLGPRLMRNRNPFELDKVMIAYNVIQIITNFYLFYKIAAEAISSPTFMLLTAFEEELEERWIYVYYYFLDKVLDLADTIFMVLRKKNSQITFLHLYHHTIMVVVSWISTAYIGPSIAAFFGAVNTFVHLVMYFYYLLTAARPEYKKSVWWKRHLTQLQLIQFIVITVHAILNILNPSSIFPKGLVAIFIPQGVIMMPQNASSIIEKINEWVSNPHKIITENISPVVREWPLMSTPTYTFAILCFYLYFCLYLGPRLMRNRKPFELDKVMIVYNVIQIVTNIYLFYTVAAEGITSPTFKLLTATEEWEDEMWIYVYYYFLDKILDLGDTIFMVLRKKNSQITFLHLYHHTMVIVVSWISTAYIGPSFAIVFGAVNTFVHSVMYFYYLLTAARPEYKKSVWWKRHLTQLQLIQFIVITVHAILNLLNPSSIFPKGLVVFFIPQGVIMYVLFWDFYKKAYNKQKKL